MTILPDGVLLESKSAREHQLKNLSHARVALALPDRSQDILNKVKSLLFALWNGVGITTTDQIADFYEVNVDTIHKIVKRHRNELGEDGLESLRGKALSDVTDKLSVTSKASRLIIWTPRAALRAGMLLRDSTVASAVRTALLDVVEKVVPAQTQEIERLQLELELAKTQERLISTSHALATLHGKEMVALILGKPDAIVTKTEEVETLVTVDSKGKALAKYDGVGISYLAKRYGFGKNTKAARAWLESIGVNENHWLSEPTLVASRKLSREILPWLDRQYAARSGVRQCLIGE